MANSKHLSIGIAVVVLGAAGVFGLSRGCSPVADHHDPITLADAANNDAAEDRAVINPTQNSNTGREATRVGCIGNDCPSGDQPGPQPDPARPPSGGAGGGAIVPGMAMPEVIVPDPSVPNTPSVEQTRVGCIGNDCPGAGLPPQPDPARR